MLVDRAVEITGRHFKFFALFTLCTLVIQAIVYFIWRNQWGLNVPGILLVPMLTTVANIRCALDLRDAQLPVREVLAWAVRRLWAVIIIDFVFGFAFLDGCYGMISADAGTMFTGALTIALTSTLVFADVYASVEPQENPLLTIPWAFMRSISLAWQNANMVRIALLALIQVALILLSIMIQQLLEAKHIHGAVFLANVPLSTLFVAPLAVLSTVIYFDCLARERAVTS